MLNRTPLRTGWRRARSQQHGGSLLCVAVEVGAAGVGLGRAPHPRVGPGGASIAQAEPGPATQASMQQWHNQPTIIHQSSIRSCSVPVLSGGVLGVLGGILPGEEDEEVGQRERDLHRDLREVKSR